MRGCCVATRAGTAWLTAWCRRGVQTCPRVRALRSLADVGHCRYYREGRGVERNAVKAAKWAGKAVAQGHVTWRTD